MSDMQQEKDEGGNVQKQTVQGGDQKAESKEGGTGGLKGGGESVDSDCVIVGESSGESAECAITGEGRSGRRAKDKATSEIHKEAEYEASIARDGHVKGQRDT